VNQRTERPITAVPNKLLPKPKFISESHAKTISEFVPKEKSSPQYKVIQTGAKYHKQGPEQKGLRKSIFDDSNESKSHYNNIIEIADEIEKSFHEQRDPNIKPEILLYSKPSRHPKSHMEKGRTQSAVLQNKRRNSKSDRGKERDTLTAVKPLITLNLNQRE
jgi:hypothetical protein